MSEHECFIAMLHDYENTDIITLSDLKDHIEKNIRLAEINHHWKSIFSLDEYCDFRKSVDLTRFKYCPFCGKKIDWQAIKRGEQNAR